MSNLNVTSDLATATPSPIIPRLILSAAGQRWEAGPEVMKMLCLTEDLVLYVSDSHANNMHVLSYIDRLEYNNVEFTIKRVRVEEIERLYRTAQNASSGAVAARSSQGTSDFQRLVMQITPRPLNLKQVMCISCLRKCFGDQIPHPR